VELWDLLTKPHKISGQSDKLIESEQCTGTADHSQTIHVGKCTGDSDTGQPRPTVISPVDSQQLNRRNVVFQPRKGNPVEFSHKHYESNDLSPVEFMPNFMDVDCQSVISNNDIMDNGSDTLLCPLLIKHFVYPLSNKRDPTLFVEIQKQSVQMLLDTGAHVSVLPQTLAQKFVDIVDDQNNKGRLVRAFGGQEIQLGWGPIYLQVDICGVAITHPFHYVNVPMYHPLVDMICFEQRN